MPNPIDNQPEYRRFAASFLLRTIRDLPTHADARRLVYSPERAADFRWWCECAGIRVEVALEVARRVSPEDMQQLYRQALAVVRPDYRAKQG